MQLSNLNNRPTDKQIHYLQILFNDCSYSDSMRNVFLTEEFGRHIRHLDELTLKEASQCINKLKEIKESF